MNKEVTLAPITFGHNGGALREFQPRVSFAPLLQCAAEKNHRVAACPADRLTPA
jgi:hypothetical protein